MIETTPTVVQGGNPEHAHKWEQGYLSTGPTPHLALAVCRECGAETVFEEMTPSMARHKLIADFQKLWYAEAAAGLTWGSTTYMGVKLWKHPSDLHLYAELMHQVQPALVIETGTAFGGSALYLAHLMDQIGTGHVVSIDLNPVTRTYPRHHRIEYIGGRSSIDARVLTRVASMVEMWGAPVLVVLDSDHSLLHVKAELDRYAHFVSPASYLVVEDTEVNGHPVFPEHGPGPYEALEQWLPKHPEFVPDTRLVARMLWSAHTWLRRERS